MKDYRLTVKVRNNRLLKAIEAVGGTPGGKWCAEKGLPYAMVNDLINMTSSPLSETGAVRVGVEKLCDILGKLPEELWSNEQLYPLERNFSEMEMSYSQVVGLLAREEQSYLPDFSEIEKGQTKKLLWEVVSTLTENEQIVIRMRFESGYSIKECAKKLGVSTSRVAQIECKALRKMRHPSRVGMMMDALDLTDAERADCKVATTKYLASKAAYDDLCGRGQNRIDT